MAMIKRHNIVYESTTHTVYYGQYRLRQCGKAQQYIRNTRLKYCKNIKMLILHWVLFCTTMRYEIMPKITANCFQFSIGI